MASQGAGGRGGEPGSRLPGWRAWEVATGRAVSLGADGSAEHGRIFRFPGRPFRCLGLSFRRLRLCGRDPESFLQAGKNCSPELLPFCGAASCISFPLTFLSSYLLSSLPDPPLFRIRPDLIHGAGPVLLPYPDRVPPCSHLRPGSGPSAVFTFPARSPGPAFSWCLPGAAGLIQVASVIRDTYAAERQKCDKMPKIETFWNRHDRT